MMIKITADSTCDLPKELLERYDISVVPLGILKGGELYRDGIEICPADIAAHVDAGGEITTTSAVNIADYEKLYQELGEKYEALIHLNIGSGFSSCHQNAKIPSVDYPRVHAVDTANLSVGQGIFVLAAAEAAAEGKGAAEIVDLLEDMTPRVELSFVLDRLDYMKKGGRCGAVAALGANLLKLHPCIEVVDGKLTVTKKYRGSTEKTVADYVRERLTDREDLDTRRIVVVDTCEDSHLREIALEIIREDGRFEEVLVSKAGCTVFSHCGPNVLGLALLKK